MKGLGRWFGQAINTATDLLYPRQCPVCRAPSGSADTTLCRSCEAELRRVEQPFCSVCGEPFEGAISTTFRCGNCAYRKFHFEFAIAGYRAIGPAREMIHSFKYSKRIALRRELARMLVEGFSDSRIDTNSGIIVPVPLHPKRRRERGFNQAEEVAKIAGKELDLPVVNALRRTRYTDTQVHMQRTERLHNMRGAIELTKSQNKSEQLKGEIVYLIDDVLTTGATAQECARILKKEAGVEKVIVVTICRAAGYTKAQK